MPGATGRGTPYPLPTDPINAYPALGQDLATKIDAGVTAIEAQQATDRTARLKDLINPGRQSYFIAAAVNIITDASGNAIVNLPAAFPNGVEAITCQPVNAPPPVSNMSIWVYNQTASLFWIRCGSGASPVANTRFDLYVIAVGY